MSGAAP